MGTDAIRVTGESWRNAVARLGARHGLAAECLDAFASYLADGEEEAVAAISALTDYDVLVAEFGPE